MTLVWLYCVIGVKYRSWQMILTSTLLVVSFALSILFAHSEMPDVNWDTYLEQHDKVNHMVFMFTCCVFGCGWWVLTLG